MDREGVFALFAELGLPEEVVRHCLAVEALCVEWARRLLKKGIVVDLDFLRVAALVHDLGRFRTHGVSHGVAGAEVLRARGEERLARVCETHVFAGLSAGEASGLGLPAKSMLPLSLEEKLVAAADNYVDGEEIGECCAKIDRMAEAWGEDHPVVERMRRLDEEVRRLLS